MPHTITPLGIWAHLLLPRILFHSQSKNFLPDSKAIYSGKDFPVTHPSLEQCELPSSLSYTTLALSRYLYYSIFYDLMQHWSLCFSSHATEFQGQWICFILFVSLVAIIPQALDYYCKACFKNPGSECQQHPKTFHIPARLVHMSKFKVTVS